jgi:hypothetical protein
LKEIIIHLMMVLHQLIQTLHTPVIPTLEVAAAAEEEQIAAAAAAEEEQIAAAAAEEEQIAAAAAEEEQIAAAEEEQIAAAAAAEEEQIAAAEIQTQVMVAMEEMLYSNYYIVITYLEHNFFYLF